MSNCVVRSRGSRLPCSIVADHGIEGGDHLSHDGDDNNFGLLVDCHKKEPQAEYALGAGT
jgi:hypothetical protein